MSSEYWDISRLWHRNVGFRCFPVGGRGWFDIFVRLGTCSLLATISVQANTAVTPVPRDADWWLERHTRFVEEAMSGGIDVVFLGDSITDGWRLEGLQSWNRYFGPKKAVNFGIDGDLTQFLLWRLQNGLLNGPKPRVFVVLIGTNNIGFDRISGLQRNTAAEALEGVGRVTETLREMAPDTRILLLGILPRGPAGALQRAQITEINSSLQKLDDGAWVHFLDIGDSLLDGNGVISPEVMPDLLHPNEAGYAIMAGAIASKIDGLLKRP